MIWLLNPKPKTEKDVVKQAAHALMHFDNSVRTAVVCILARDPSNIKLAQLNHRHPWPGALRDEWCAPPQKGRISRGKKVKKKGAPQANQRLYGARA
jgi:hypothetical protein